MGQWEFIFSTTEFEDIYFKITQYEGEENNTLFYFTEKLLAHVEPQSDRPVFVRIDELNITEGRFLMVDENSSVKPRNFKKSSLKPMIFLSLMMG